MNPIPQHTQTHYVVEAKCHMGCKWEQTWEDATRKDEREAKRQAEAHVEHTGHHAKVIKTTIDWYEPEELP